MNRIPLSIFELVPERRTNFCRADMPRRKFLDFFSSRQPGDDCARRHCEEQRLAAS
jgi:hypothetical protein